MHSQPDWLNSLSLQKSTIRVLREESHLARTCGIVAVLVSASASYSLESVLSRKMMIIQLLQFFFIDLFSFFEAITQGV